VFDSDAASDKNENMPDLKVLHAKIEQPALAIDFSKRRLPRRDY
jgi:hypothetical protein